MALITSQSVSGAASELGVRHTNAGRSAVPALHQDAAFEHMKQNWFERSSGGVMPYAFVGGGPMPGLPKQEISGFSLTAQASSATNPLGQTPSPGVNATKRVTILLDATTNQPEQKNISWELALNGIGVDGAMRGDTQVSTVEMRRDSRGELTGELTQYLHTRESHQGKYVFVRGILREFENLEEPLPFRTPSLSEHSALPTKDNQSQTSQSGVSVTLASNALTTIGAGGGTDIQKLSFQIVPAQSPIALPLSPLYRKYQKPVLVRIGAMTPSGPAFDYPFSEPASWVSLYKQPSQPWQYGSNPNILTLVVQQRVYFHEVLFALKVPVRSQPFRSSVKHP